MRTLVVGTTLGDLFRTGAQAGHRYHDFKIDDVLVILALADKRYFVIEQALDARCRCCFIDKEVKGHLYVAYFCIQQAGHLGQHDLE